MDGTAASRRGNGTPGRRTPSAGRRASCSGVVSPTRSRGRPTVDAGPASRDRPGRTGEGWSGPAPALAGAGAGAPGTHWSQRCRCGRRRPGGWRGGTSPPTAGRSPPPWPPPTWLVPECSLQTTSVGGNFFFFFGNCLGLIFHRSDRDKRPVPRSGLVLDPALDSASGPPQPPLPPPRAPRSAPTPAEHLACSKAAGRAGNGGGGGGAPRDGKVPCMSP